MTVLDIKGMELEASGFHGDVLVEPKEEAGRVAWLESRGGRRAESRNTRVLTFWDNFPGGERLRGRGTPL